MLSRKLLLPVAVVGLLAFLPVNASAQATIPDKPVFLTFANPVALPGTTLPAGEYEFRQSASSRADRAIVEVRNRANGEHVVTVAALPATLTDGQPVPEEPTVRFYETAATTPAPIQSWWYPGIRNGWEFIYPREQAMEIARLNPDGVPSAQDPAESGEVTRVRAGAEAGMAAAEPRAEAAPRAEAEQPAPTMAQRDDAAPRAQGDMAMNAQDPADREMAEPRTALPQTATTRGWLAAAGVFSVVAGLVLMARRRVV
jgi:LPXTG-motif cell wall-anchored protein